MAFDSVGQLLALREQLQGALPSLTVKQPPSTLPASLGAATGQIAANAGNWMATLSPAEYNILKRESNFNPTAKNPKSTAFGIWQGLESTRKQYLGPNWQTTDPILQLQAFRRYVGDRYGSAENAWNFWQKNRWY